MNFILLFTCTGKVRKKSIEWKCKFLQIASVILFTHWLTQLTMPTIPSNKKRPVWAGERRAFESGRRNARWEGYKKQYWRDFSKAFKIANPTCSEPGCGQPTYYSDHTIPIRDWIAQGGNPLDTDNIKPKCFKHGNKKTGHEGKSKQMEYARK